MTDQQELPTISIALVTCKRLDVAMRTVTSTCANLGYPRDRRGWYIGDDGSPEGEFSMIKKQVLGLGENLFGDHNQRMRNPGQEDTFFAGKGWNLALGLSHQRSDFVLWLEDDWELDHPLDLVPYVRLLQENDEVGMVSFRILSVGNEVKTVGHDGLHYLEYMRTTQYSYSGNPQLRHARYTKHYGVFAEDVNPGGIELNQDDKYRLDVNNGPKIWRPAGIDPWGAWKHIGQEKSWK